MPSSSILCTSDASLYRCGRCDRRSVARIFFLRSMSPLFIEGSRATGSSVSSSVDSRYTRIKPSKVITSPVATNFSSLPLMPIVAVVFSKVASAIWLASVRRYIR